VVGKGLDIHSYLFEVDSNNVIKPKKFGWRIAALLILALGTLFLLNMTIILVPIVLGRLMFHSVIGASVSDIYSYVLGFYVVWGLSLAGKFAIVNITSHALSHLVKRVIHFSLIAIKWVFLLGLWLVFIPFLIGIFFELSVLLPFRVPANESPNFFIYHDWAFGLLYLKIWFRITMLEAFPANSWKLKFEKVLSNGLTGVNVTETMKEIIIPIAFPLLLMLTIPYVVVQGLVPLFVSSVYIQSICFRFSYLVMISGYLSHEGAKMLFSWFPKFKQAIIDDKYLVGQKLHNFEIQSEDLITN